MTGYVIYWPPEPRRDMEDHSEDTFHALRRAVHNDPKLQAHLFAHEDPNAFIDAVCELAHSLGHKLGREAVLQIMRDGHKAWHRRSSL